MEIIDMENFQPFIENSLFFNSTMREKDKNIVKGLILEVCQQIEQHDEILEVRPNIEAIICKPPEGDHAGDIRSPFGGLTLKSSWRDLVIYNPVGLEHRETQLFILAHEFAHVFLKHTSTNSNQT